MIVIDSPLPPSLNQLWRVGKGRIYKNPKHAVWLREFACHWYVTKPRRFRTIEGPIEVEILICPKRKRDVDNTAKSLLDSLQALRIIANDSQVRKLTSELVDKERAPLGCRITISSSRSAR